MKKGFLIQFTNKIIVVIICVMLLQPALCAGAVIPNDPPLIRIDAEIFQTADLIGVRQEAEQILAAGSSMPNSDVDRLQLRHDRALVLRKIFLAILQVEEAKNRLETEMSYAYDLSAKHQRKSDTVNQFFNVANFMQFGVLYTIEPFLRIHHRFTESATLTCIGAGLGMLLPVLNIAYNKFDRVSNMAPPAFLEPFLDGKPVDGSNLPPLITKYLATCAPGTTVSRREALNAIWKQRYRADLEKKETLAGIDDGKSKSPFVLKSRIILLWSMYTAVQGLDKDLLNLLNKLRNGHEVNSQSAGLKMAKLGGGADEAARLLHLEPLLAELNSVNTGSERKTELQITLMETILAGYLDMHTAGDACQEELNYQYDVVLAQMTARRGKFLQKTYEANFIQSGVLGACAGERYLSHHGKTGNELFIVSNSLGIAITTISLLATHGGWRKNERGPNSLADFFELRTSAFSPLVQNFLNSESPQRNDGLTRRHRLLEIWKKQVAAGVDLKKSNNQAKLGSMPGSKWDTINLVVNRIALLTSLREQFSEFDGELRDLLVRGWPDNSVAETSSANSIKLGKSAGAAAKLLRVEGLVDDALGANNESAKILITRKVLQGFLDTDADAGVISYEILKESQVVDRMSRQRDLAIQLTNILNFYQIGILGVTSDSMGLSKNKNVVLAGNRLNIVSGYLISCLALTALVERHGGLRPEKASPNALSTAFGAKSEYVNLSPLMVNYLNTVSPISVSQLTRREELIRYWSESKILTMSVKKESNIEKLSAEGKKHHWWDENIKLIHNRIAMLYDLRGTLRSSNVGFDQLLRAID